MSEETKAILYALLFMGVAAVGAISVDEPIREHRHTDFNAPTVPALVKRYMGE